MTLNLLRSARILLVDDNPTNLKVLSETITHQEDWTVLVATDGESAIEQVSYAKPDLILLDVMMPGIDGFETCRRLKANPNTQTMPIIFMTALSDTSHKVRGLELGAVDYITKPFQQAEVLARVKLHLKLSSLTQHLEEKNTLLSAKITEQAATEEELQTLTQELEQRVKQRTEELSQSLEQLQQTQLQLIQHEKMSMLGNLIAGIAHEINNPIGFLHGNLQPTKEYIFALLGLLELYRKTFPTPGDEIEAMIQNIELDFIRRDLPKILNSTTTGIERIHDISVSLRTFSRADKEHKIPFDVREGLDSTLLILKHRLKANNIRPEIQIIKDFQDIPNIECFAGQLNQVFMNLLANAIDSIDEKSRDRRFEDLEAQPNIITVKTHLEPDQENISIQVQDNGVGMNEVVKNKIFEHLFTTKEVGKGTGLGLAIAQQIVVAKHQGTIEVESTLGLGTTFTIVLPIQASPASSSPLFPTLPSFNSQLAESQF